MTTPPTDQQLDEIQARAAAMFAHADLGDEDDQREAERLAGTDVPLLAAEVRRQRTELAAEQRRHGDTIDDRDRAQDAADKLAYAVAPENVIGEHTADNSPWENALDLITPKAEVDRLRAELERRTEDVAFLERVTLPELRREVEHHKDGKQRWRERAETAEARSVELAAVHAFLDEQDRAARLFELPTPAWVEAVRAASAAPAAPLSASPASESAQSPTGAPEGAPRASGPATPPRRTLTPNEYSAAWHAVEGAAGDEGADPGTVLHAVLDRLGIQWQDAAQPAATTPAR